MTRDQKLALIAIILGSGVVFLDGSIVNLALPTMAKELHVGFAGLQWIVDGYLLSLSALILLGGSLGDIIGRKRMYFIGVAGFAVASLLCGLAPNAPMLIAARIVQGAFGALMVPGALALINTNFDATKRAQAIGTWTAWTSAIIAVAPLLGGVLIDSGSWRLIFFINIPLLLVCYWLGKQSIKETKDSRNRELDLLGASLAIGSLAGMTYGLIEGPAKHWSLLPVLSLVAGAVLFAAFIYVERKHRDPMLEISLFKNRNFTGANIATFAMYGALGGFFFALVIHLQSRLGYSSLEAGLSSLPVTLFLLGLSSRVGALSAKVGPRLFMTIGPILAGVGIISLFAVNDGTSYASGILPGICLFGLGMAATVAPLTTTVLDSVETNQSGIASAVNNAVSRVSGLIVVAFLGFFGASQSYRFAVLLCGVLAVAAGIISFFSIQNRVVLAKEKAKA
jgi:EmrB/QacA subfamily drug resistance transporter